MNDVVVNITRLTLPVTQAGFGMPLILSTNGVFAYKEYGSIAEVAEDFDAGSNGYGESEEHKMARRIFGQDAKLPKLAIYGIDYTAGVTATSALATALNTLIETNNDFYFLLCIEQGDDEIEELSDWAEAQEKIYFAATDNLSLVTGISNDRTAVMYHNEADEYPDAAWVGKCGPELPGSITWKFKRLAGIDKSTITSTQLGTLHDSGGNSYVEKMGQLQTSEGKVTSGEFIDVIRSQDFVVTRIRERIQNLLFISPKVPYDNAGIALVTAEVESVMKLATGQGIIATDTDGNGLYEVTSPDRSEIDTQDVANRNLPDINFNFTLAGAVHSVVVNGVIKV